MKIRNYDNSRVYCGSAWAKEMPRSSSVSEHGNRSARSWSIVHLLRKSREKDWHSVNAGRARVPTGTSASNHPKICELLEKQLRWRGWPHVPDP